jgi:hypothetical protein
MATGVESRGNETSATFPHDALASRCLVWHDRQSDRQFAILAEPASTSLIAERAAQAAMFRLWESLREYRLLEPADAIYNAMTDAHQTVRKANLLPGGQRRAELGLVGVSICLIDQNELTLGLASPSQTLVLQDDEIYPVPPFRQRRPEILFDDLIVDAAPLGSATFRPALFSSPIEPGDRIMLCSDGVAAQLAKIEEQYPGKLRGRLASLLRATPEHAAPKLRELLGPGDDDMLMVLAPGEEPGVNGEPQHFLVRHRTTNTPASGPVTHVVAGNDVVVNTVSATPAAPRVLTPPVLASKGPGAVAPISSGVLQRHVPHGSPMRESMRAWMPRGPWERIPLWSVGLLIALVLIAGGANKWYGDRQDAAAQVKQYLAEADLQLSTLGVSTDNDVVRDQVAAAQAALDNARANGANPDALATREASLVVARDRIDGVHRLESVQVIGVLPLTARQATVPKLVRAGGQVYLLDGAVYRIDSANGQLIELLTSGTKVGKITSQPITDGTVDSQGLVVTDGFALYSLQPDETWKAVALGLRDSGQAWNVTSVAAFDGAWYLLNGDGGSILKFDAKSLDKVPTDWTQGANRAELTGAVDFAIDGSIYVLTQSGNLAIFYKGALTPPADGETLPKFSDPQAIYAGLDTTYIWVLDIIDGTPSLVRVERETMETVTYTLPYGWDTSGGLQALGQIRDMVVLENRGEVLFATDAGIWTASVPLVE